MLTRRQFAQAAAAAGAVLAFGKGSAAAPAWRERRDLYPQGVASGDPAPDSVLLWTRRQPADGDARAVYPLTVEVAKDPDFHRVVVRGQTEVTADTDWTCRFMAAGLKPATDILGNHKLPLPPNGATMPPYNGPVFYNATVADQNGTPVSVRIAALYVGWGEDDTPQTMLVQVAKSRASRDALAGQILVDMALPLSGLVLLMSVIVRAGIRAGLAPLARLRDAVVDRAPDDLTPIQLATSPEEVRVLVNALNELLHAVQHSVAGQRRFISDAAHQLRTPLAGPKSHDRTGPEGGWRSGAQGPAAAGARQRHAQRPPRQPAR